MSFLPTAATGTYSCPCCGVPTPGTKEQAAARVPCKPCQDHGHNAISKDRIHQHQWASTLRQLQTDVRTARAEQKLAEKEASVLREALLERYDSDGCEALTAKLSSEIVAKAQQEKAKAYDRDAEVMSILLLDVEPRHRGDARGACSCGRSVTVCSEWTAVEPMRDHLADWERLQLRRMRESKPFGLPLRHPDVAAFYERHRDAEFKGLDEARIRYARRSDKPRRSPAR